MLVGAKVSQSERRGSGVGVGAEVGSAEGGIDGGVVVLVM